jgi:hypothetical protein
MIVLTVPHAVAPLWPGVRDDDHHESDVLAERASIALEAALQRTQIPTRRFVAQVPRIVCDLNRNWCRQEGFRPAVTELLGRRKQKMLLLDIHSFPAFHMALDFYIIYEPASSTRSKRLAASLCAAIQRDTESSCHMFPGDGNDIIAEADSLGVPALLLEFNETLSNEQLEAITAAIASWAETLVITLD